MTLALFLFATGVFELATGIDLFQYKGSELVREASGVSTGRSPRTPLLRSSA